MVAKQIVQRHAVDHHARHLAVHRADGDVAAAGNVRADEHEVPLDDSIERCRVHGPIEKRIGGDDVDRRAGQALVDVLIADRCEQ